MANKHSVMESVCFTALTLPVQKNGPRLYVQPKTSRRRPLSVSMNAATNGRISLYGGIAILTAVLANRLAFTPLESLALTQSRSDILGVIAGATLVLYGVGKAEITDQKQAVELSGVDVSKGFDDIPGSDAIAEVEWAATALLEAIPNVRSVAVVVDGVGRCFMGRFRFAEVAANVVVDGVIERALNTGVRAYLADLKTVPVKEVEFGFLPDNCQAVIVQPVTEGVAVILGADKARPFTATDFGWLQAISDRLAGVMGSLELSKEI